MSTLSTPSRAGRKLSVKGKYVPEGVNIDDIDFSKVPPMPEGMGTIAEQKWVWIWGVCAWLKPADSLVVRELCEYYEELEYIKNKLKLMGEPFYLMPNGVLAEHPWNKLKREMEKNIAISQATLGLNPTDRARLELTSDAASELAKLIERRPGAGEVREV